MTQFCTSDSASTFVLRKTSPSSSYFTFASGGYIIRIRPTAIGIDVVPTWNVVIEPHDARQEVAGAHADGHGQEDPQRQVAVEERQTRRHVFGHW